MAKKMIGILDLDSCNNTLKNSFPNLALMKISSHFKSKGKEVKWYSPLFDSQFERVYVSKVFTFKTSPLEHYVRNDERIIKGGIAFFINKKLPEEIEHVYPDYQLYGLDFSLGFLTRGCIRDCKFCVVREKEGFIHRHANLEEFTRDQEKVMLLDNNILSYPEHEKILKKLIKTDKRFDFNQGIDIRLINEENAKLLSQLRRWQGRRIRFAFDDIRLMNIIKSKLKVLMSNGFTKNMIMFYILTGFNSSFEEDLKRVLFLRKRRIDPYIMVYNNIYKPHLQLLRRWVNFKPIFWKYSWEDFLRTQENRKEYKTSKKTLDQTRPSFTLSKNI